MKLFSSIHFTSKSAFLLIVLISSIFGNYAHAQVYCTPSSSNPCSSGDFIDDFSLNTLSNQNSGCNGNANNYFYYTTPTTSLEKGGAYSISMQSGPSYPQGFGVWIDYNQSNSFETSEFVYGSPNYSTDPFSAYITIPTTTTTATGTTRLRVRSNYYGTVTANESCATYTYGETEDYDITIVQPPTCSNPPIAGTATASTNIVCDGNTTFYLTLNGCPNGAGQTYQWQQSTNGISWTTIPGATTKAISQTILQSTHFRCLVTCGSTSISDPVFVSLSTPFNLNLTSTDVSCYGLNNGSVTAMLTGGTSPYTYSWSVFASPTPPPQILPNAAMLNNVYAGDYTALITDANGCSVTGTKTVAQPWQLFLSPNSSSSTCGSATGTVSVSVSNGTLPYSYSWQGGQTSTSITAVPVGIYSVTVTDGNNCTASTAIGVSENGTSGLSFSIVNASCPGGNNGSVTVSTGANTPAYAWNTTPIQTTATATGLSAGNYFVTVTESGVCKAINNVTVGQPSPLTSGAQSYSVTCIGSCNGSVTTSVMGGTWPYTYSWSNGSTALSISNLCAGNYTVIVTDGNGCSLVNTKTVAQPAALVANTTKKDVSCFGLSDGLISVLPSGGKPPYSFNWSPLNTVGDTAIGLSPGTYSVIVTDAGTCGATYTASATIIQPTAITAVVTSTDATCHGTCTGSATANPSGGTSPYTYLWSANAQITQVASFLCADSYTVVITDKNNCERTDTVSVGQPLAVPITTSITPTSCSTQSGAATASVSGAGAFPPYSYLWTTGSTASSISGLEAGIYRANVVDGNGCFGFADAVITSSNGPAVTTTSVTPVSCFGLSNGAINISVTGGSAPYTYSWSNGKTTQDISNLSYGPYEVKVKDATGCIVMKSILVNEPAQLSLTSAIINSGCTVNNGYASVAGVGGTSPYSYLWSIGGTTSAKAGLGAGVYKIKITDSKGCKDSTLLAVEDTGGPVMFLDTVVGANCGGSGHISMNPLDASSMAGYQWNTGSTTQNLSNVAAGNYGLIATDTSGCKSVHLISVNPVLPPLKPICLVTVDTLTNANMVVWEKPISALIAGFNIYRESSKQGVYQKIAYSPYGNESVHYDSIADPDIKWARYKISMVDICGKEGQLSPDHKTIHMSIQSYTASSTTLIWDAYVGYSFSYYNIYRKAGANGTWELIGARPATLPPIYTDATFPQTGDTIFYHVDVDHPGSDCNASIKNPNPMATSVRSSKSNADLRTTNPVSVSEISADTWMSIYPNPSSGIFTVSSNTYEVTSINIYNMLGENVYRKNVNAKKIEVTIPDVANGIYQLRVVTASGIINKKIVISR